MSPYSRHCEETRISCPLRAPLSLQGSLVPSGLPCFLKPSTEETRLSCPLTVGAVRRLSSPDPSKLSAVRRRSSFVPSGLPCPLKPSAVRRPGSSVPSGLSCPLKPCSEETRLPCTPPGQPCEETGCPQPLKPGLHKETSPCLAPFRDMGLLSPSSPLLLSLLEVTAGPSPPSPCLGRPGGLRLAVPVVQGTDPSAVIHGSPPYPALTGPAPGRSWCPGVGVAPGCAATVLVKPGREGTCRAGVSGGMLWGRCSH